MALVPSEWKRKVRFSAQGNDRTVGPEAKKYIYIYTLTLELCILNEKFFKERFLFFLLNLGREVGISLKEVSIEFTIL